MQPGRTAFYPKIGRASVRQSITPFHPFYIEQLRILFVLMGTVPIAVVCMILILIPPFAISQSNYCCTVPDFGSNWCHSGSCLGNGCRNEPDPITKQSQSNYLCDDLSNCICAGATSFHPVSALKNCNYCLSANSILNAGMVKYQSMSFCTVKKSCANAKTG